MLDDYKTNQPIIYRILKNAVSKDSYSHAYLFETNGFYDSQNLVKAFVKTILCPHHYINNLNCKNCHQCEVINSGNHPEIEIIKPDGIWIKKVQVQELQSNFTKKAVLGTTKIYIITEADKLKTEAANSILKFLEEPEPGIIAILLTENLYQVLETIRSRCQILTLKNQNQPYKSNHTLDKLLETYYLNENSEATEEIKNKIEKVINFVTKYEKNNLSTILYTQKLWHQYITTKDDYKIAFEIMILYYKDILNFQTNRKLEYFTDYQNEIKKISSKNTVDNICQKLTLLTDYKEKLKYNANTSLLMDKLIIDLEGGDLCLM